MQQYILIHAGKEFADVALEYPAGPSIIAAHFLTE